MQGIYKKAFVTVAAILFVAGSSLADDPIGTGTVSSADVQENENQTGIGGTSTVYRGAAGIGMRAYVNGLRGDFPYTVWAVIFNYPQACMNFPDPCTAADFDPAGPTQTRVTQAARNYSDDDGTGFFSGFIPVGAALFNANRAEVHFIYRRHPDDNDAEYESLNMVGGNCTAMDGPSNDQCQDEGFSIHKR